MSSHQLCFAGYEVSMFLGYLFKSAVKVLYKMLPYYDIAQRIRLTSVRFCFADIVKS